MPPAGGAWAKASIPRKRTWRPRPSGALDYRIGFAGQIVMPPGCEEAPDDRRRRRSAVDHVVSDSRSWPRSVKARCIERHLHDMQTDIDYLVRCERRIGLR
jgi:hypothetical protein